MTLDANIMDQKKTQKTVVKPVETPVESSKVITFVGDIKEEFKKITWTSREELITYTKMVIGATFLFGMSIFFIDLLIQSSLNTLGYLVRLIGG
jgi:preprotein translocase subunit SecE